MEIIEEVLLLFKENDVRAGQSLDKSKFTEKFKNYPMEKKIEVREAWHVLVGQGLIIEIQGKGPTLTKMGESLVYREEE